MNLWSSCTRNARTKGQVVAIDLQRHPGIDWLSDTRQNGHAGPAVADQICQSPTPNVALGVCLTSIFCRPSREDQARHHKQGCGQKSQTPLHITCPTAFFLECPSSQILPDLLVYPVQHPKTASPLVWSMSFPSRGTPGAGRVSGVVQVQAHPKLWQLNICNIR